MAMLNNQTVSVGVFSTTSCWQLSFSALEDLETRCYACCTCRAFPGTLQVKQVHVATRQCDLLG
jgi:hypothetical protein